VFKLPVDVSIDDNLLVVDDVNTFKLPVVVSKEFNLVIVVPLIAAPSRDEILLSCDKLVAATDDDIKLKFSPLLISDDVTWRLWTFICK
jgi:hypothetical protein